MKPAVSTRRPLHGQDLKNTFEYCIFQFLPLA